MDEELIALEEELKRLRPVIPPTRLMAALDNELGRKSRSSLRWISWLGLPVAAAIAAWVIYAPANQTASITNTEGVVAAAADPAKSPTFKPVAAQNVLVSESDDGLITLADGTHVRRTRQAYLDRITWENPATHASLTWTLPREEVKVVPVSFQ